MTRFPRMLVVAAVFTVSLAGLRVARAQDPAVVNADTIKARLENPHVRVLEATLPPGAKEKPHSHPAYVIYVVKGGKVLNHAADGKTNEAEFKDGDVIYRDAIPQHWAENIGTTTMHLILVELKPGS